MHRDLLRGSLVVDGREKNVGDVSFKRPGEPIKLPHSPLFTQQFINAKPNLRNQIVIIWLRWRNGSAQDF